MQKSTVPPPIKEEPKPEPFFEPKRESITFKEPPSSKKEKLDISVTYEVPKNKDDTKKEEPKKELNADAASAPSDTPDDSKSGKKARRGLK